MKQQIPAVPDGLTIVVLVNFRDKCSEGPCASFADIQTGVREIAGCVAGAPCSCCAVLAQLQLADLRCMQRPYSRDSCL